MSLHTHEAVGQGGAGPLRISSTHHAPELCELSWLVRWVHCVHNIIHDALIMAIACAMPMAMRALSPPRGRN